MGASRRGSAPICTEVEEHAFRAFAEGVCGIIPSPLVGAIWDASAGTPVALADALVERYFGCAPGQLPTAPPRTVVVRAGGRGGKTSRLIAPKALHAAWTVPLPTLGPGEEAYSLLIAPDLKLARQALSFCKGYVEASPRLTAALLCAPTQDEITLRRPDGRVCKVAVAAANRGGKGGRGKSLVFAGLDEACFFRDEATGVINDTEIYRAVLQRVVPGGQCWIASTPWVAGVGLLEELLAKNWGTHDTALCVTAPTRALNPTWDPTGEIEADLRAQDPDAAEREIDAVPLTAGSQQFFSREAILQAVNAARPQRLARVRGAAYASGGDAAFKRNSSALVVVERQGERYRVATVEELRPERGLPLKPSAVVDHFAAVMRDYGETVLVVDAHERDEIALEFARHQMGVTNAPAKVEGFIVARKLFHEGKVELPDDPRLVRQLCDVVAKPQPGGGLSITSPRRADGSHGDRVSALVLALWRAALVDPSPARPRSVGTPRGPAWG